MDGWITYGRAQKQTVLNKNKTTLIYAVATLTIVLPFHNAEWHFYSLYDS